VATLALCAVLAQMDVVLAMAGTAVLGQFDFARGLAMALGALELAVCAGEREAIFMNRREWLTRWGNYRRKDGSIVKP
jgi:hypothetical protein